MPLNNNAMYGKYIDFGSPKEGPISKKLPPVIKVPKNNSFL